MNSENKHRAISAEEFDRKFSAGVDMSQHVDWSKATKRVSIRLPSHVLKDLEAEANRRGITRDRLIEIWIADGLDDAKQVLSAGVGAI